jgi:hypothetical protein
MNKFYSLIVSLFAVFMVAAQPTIPGNPGACNANNCTTNALIDVCPAGGSTVISSTINGAYNRGNNPNHLGEGAIWRYRNFATVGGVTVNMEVTIDDISNATLESIDDDAADDQAGNSIGSFFSPRIGPDVNLNGTNRRGYVQFTMKFYKNSTGTNNNSNSDFANTVNLSNINYVHYDIDGNDAGNVASGTAGSWFRETGMAQRVSVSNPQVLANSATDLIAYNYTDPVATSWTGYAGGICERDGVSRCAQVASSFSFSGSLPSITFRMGYDYNAGGNIGRPVRQYGSRLGCFNFPQQITLPVKLLAFSGSYNGSKTLLSWETANEVNFDRYDVERSTNGSDYLAIASEKSKTGIAQPKYQFSDDLNGSYENVFYYRLRMVDIDGKYSYSNVIMVRKDQKQMASLIISPNPVFGGGVVTIRLGSESKKSVEVRVIDNSGKIVLKQQNQLNEGINSISFNNQSHLQSGIYTVQVVADDEILSSKLSVIR